MGIDFMCFAEKYENERWVCVGSGFFDSADAWGPLVSDRYLPAILEERGFPEDMSEEVLSWLVDATGMYYKTWVCMNELISYDYDQEDNYYNYESRKFIKGTRRDAMGDLYLEDLKKLQDLKAERLIIWLEY